GPPATTSPETSLVTRLGLTVGAALWFVALAVLAFVFIRPRERRAQLPGFAAAPTAGRRSLSELADRASLVADRSLERHGRRGGLNTALERAGIDLRPGEFVV